METPTANTLISDHIIKALCNTLMHSLWQGVLLAVIAGAIIIFTKKASAAYRYNLLIGALALFAGGVVFTFMVQLQQPHGNSITYVVNTPGTAPVTMHAIATPFVQQNVKEGISEIVINYLNTHYNIIVLIWFLIICAKSVQMAVGLHGVYHLKRTKVFAVSKDWDGRLLQLTEQLHIKQMVKLMESGIAKVPMVIGHLKPVVLIPIGLINSLTIDEVEAILIHELAHIRRRDYLVNLLQSFMEIIFFFNPAVLWISQLIKTERENCCDDLALQQSSNKLGYIKALVSCEEYQANFPAYAMGFPGSKNNLLARVKRLMGNQNHSLNMFEKTVLAVCLVVFGLGISAFTARENIKKAVKSVVSIIHHDAKTEPKEIAVANGNNAPGKMAGIPVNNTVAQQSPVPKSGPANPDTGKQAGLSPLKTLTDKVDSLRHANNGMQQSGLAALSKMDSTSFKRFHSIGLELYRERLVTDTNHLNISLNDHELIVNGVRMPQQVFERISRQFGRKGETGSYSSSYSSTAPYGGRGNYYSADTNGRGRNNYKKRYPTGQERRIIAQMQGEDLVNDPNDLSFLLTNKKLVINGVLQSDDVFQRYRQEYVPANAGDNWDWNYHSTAGSSYSPYANGYRNSGAYYQAQGEERRRQAEEIDKKLVADLLQDGLITDPNNVTFSLTDKRITVNGKTQSDDIYRKYKEKYRPNSTGPNWTWSYSHHE